MVNYDQEMRLSHKDRDDAVSRLQSAFLEGRLDDGELGDRVKAALGAKVRGDLVPILGDLPVSEIAVVPTVGAIQGPAAPLKLVSTYKSSETKGGSFVLGSRFKTQVYKGNQVLDLTKAQFSGDRVEIKANCYKGTLIIIVPRGFRVDLRGWAYKGGMHDQTSGEGTRPLVLIKANAYKGKITIVNP